MLKFSPEELPLHLLIFAQTLLEEHLKYQKS
jgi:hypothetical protein